MYFLIAEMALVDHMYQTSLAQFLSLFDQSINTAAQSPITSKRIQAIIDNLTWIAFRFVSKGLFNTHKLLFVLQLALKIDMKKGIVSGNEFSAFVKGGAALDITQVKARPFAWLPDAAWLNVVALSSVSIFTALPQQIASSGEVWRKWYDEEEPEKADLPAEYQGKLNMFQKMLLVRALREDRAMLAAMDYIVESLGERFGESSAADLEESIDQAGPTTPLVFLLSLGSDPSSIIDTLAKKRKIDLKYISMGQGQEVHARRLIGVGLKNGGWVQISNSHLGLKFMSEIETILMAAREEENINQNFRLILTTEPHEKFPIGLLQMSIKLTNEPPTGCRAGLRRSYQLLTQDTLEAVDKPQWLPLVYVIAFIHTTVQERRKYGPLGFCIPYEFGTPDFSSSIQFLQTYLYSLDPRK
ncbi:dynein heavy chain, partial [Kipferlia bialata]|eukprot:g11083.t1